MKERGISSRVNRITSIDIAKPALVDTINYVSTLVSESPSCSLSSVVKQHKLAKYKNLISQLKPVVDRFSDISELHNDLLAKLNDLDSEVSTRIVKTSAAIKLGKSIHLELCGLKGKKHVLDLILAKLDPYDVKNNIEIENESILTALNKLASSSDLNK